MTVLDEVAISEELKEELIETIDEICKYSDVWDAEVIQKEAGRLIKKLCCQICHILCGYSRGEIARSDMIKLLSIFINNPVRVENLLKLLGDDWKDKIYFANIKSAIQLNNYNNSEDIESILGDLFQEAYEHKKIVIPTVNKILLVKLNFEKAKKLFELASSIGKKHLENPAASFLEIKQEIIPYIELQNSLKVISNESTEFIQMPMDYLMSDKFRKVDEAEIANIVSLNIQALPRLATSVSNIALSEKISSIVDGGVFKVVFKEGVNDKSIADLYKNSEGLKITVYRDNNGFNQAGLSSVGQEITDTVNPIKVTNVVNGVMAVLSVVVGCYYMHNINCELKDLNLKIGTLIGMFDDSKLAKLKSNYEFFTETVREFSAKLLNPKQINSRYDEVVYRRNECKELADFYEYQLRRIVNGFGSTSDNLKSFESAINDLNKNMECYKFAVELYGIANFVEVVLSENHSSEYLKARVDKVKQYSKSCYSNIEEWYESTESWISEAKALHANEWMAYSCILPLSIAYLIDDNYKENKKISLLSDLEQHKDSKYNLNDGVNALINYSNRMNLIQNKEFNMYYHNGDMYIEKDDLEMEEK